MPRRKPGTPPVKTGRKPHIPTDKDRQTVEIMAGFGLPVDRIALVIGVSEDTVERKYRQEIKRGVATVEAKLAGNLLRLASGNDGTAMKAVVFALQCRFGWKFPVDPSNPEAIGKKVAAQLAARTAGETSDWGDDLRPGDRPN